MTRYDIEQDFRTQQILGISAVMSSKTYQRIRLSSGLLGTIEQRSDLSMPKP